MSDPERIIEAVLARGCTSLAQALRHDLDDAGNISPGAATTRVRHMILLGRLYDWTSFTGCGWVKCDPGSEPRYEATRYTGGGAYESQVFDDGDLALAWVCGVEVTR